MKTILASKTVQFNILSFLLFLFALPNFISLIPENWLPWIGMIVAIVNYVLRTFFTAQPITQFAANQVAPTEAPPIQPEE